MLNDSEDSSSVINNSSLMESDNISSINTDKDELNNFGKYKINMSFSVNPYNNLVNKINNYVKKKFFTYSDELQGYILTGRILRVFNTGEILDDGLVEVTFSLEGIYINIKVGDEINLYIGEEEEFSGDYLGVIECFNKDDQKVEYSGKYKVLSIMNDCKITVE